MDRTKRRSSRKDAARPRTGAAYLGNRFLGHAEKDLSRLAECCDYVVHTLGEADLYYHKAALSKIFDATRRRGLEVWADPWGVGGVFGGEAFSKFLLDHPDHWQELSNGRRVPMACLNSGLFRDFMREWVLSARDAGAQVIFWDEPHVFFHWNLEWEGTYACACPRCRALFKEWAGEAAPKHLTAAAREFRRRTLRLFLDDLTGFARRRQLGNALCLYAFEGYSDYDRLWSDLASLPSLDIFGCDPYWRWGLFRGAARPPAGAAALEKPADYVRYFCEKALKESRRHKKESQIWIQAMRLPQGAEKDIAPVVRAAAGSGVTHLAAWSYDGGALLDPVLSENPARVWEEVARAFRGLRGNG